MTTLDLHPRLANAMQTITRRRDGTVTTSLGEPTHITTNHTEAEVIAALTHGPILITSADYIAQALRPGGRPWGCRGGGILHVSVDQHGILRNAIDGHTWVYELHPAKYYMQWTITPPSWSCNDAHCISEAWYIARWVD